MELWGKDLWVNSSHPLQSKILPKSITEFYFQDLLVYTRYIARVYVRNEGNKVNRNFPLELTGQTMATAPKSPTNIKLVDSISF